MRLTLLTHSAPDSSNQESIVGIAKAALAQGHEVTIFVMADGVKGLGGPALAALAADGATITACEHNVEERNAPTGVSSINYGSQYDLANYMAEGDRLVSFLQ